MNRLAFVLTAAAALGPMPTFLPPRSFTLWWQADLRAWRRRRDRNGKRRRRGSRP